MKILTVCGAGQGTSLILKMNVEEAAQELGYDNVEVENTDITSAKTSNADLIMAGDYHEDSLEDMELPVYTVGDFMDKAEIKEKLKKYRAEEE